MHIEVYRRTVAQEEPRITKQKIFKNSFENECSHKYKILPTEGIIQNIRLNLQHIPFNRSKNEVTEFLLRSKHSLFLLKRSIS
jgi:hypothetical protein